MINGLYIASLIFRDLMKLTVFLIALISYDLLQADAFWEIFTELNCSSGFACPSLRRVIRFRNIGSLP